jgi:hypothetical protein
MGEEGQQQSFIEFGGYEYFYAKNTNNIIWFKLVDNFFWTVTCNAYKIGPYKNGKTESYTISKSYVVFDTGSSLTYLPSCNFL